MSIVAEIVSESDITTPLNGDLLNVHQHRSGAVMSFMENEGISDKKSQDFDLSLSRYRHVLPAYFK
ncbi:hypothetical protein BH10PLA1_BH10PLA1_01620 [soil metagenome]